MKEYKVITQKKIQVSTLSKEEQQIFYTTLLSNLLSVKRKKEDNFQNSLSPREV